MRNNIISEVEKRDRINNHVDSLMYTLRKHCPHAEVVEAPYRRDDETRNELPKRICLCCGLEEQASGFSGMSDGFKKLEKSTVVKGVPLEEFSSYRKLRSSKELRQLQPV
ncbi:MAG: hypothetical protein AAB815_02820 [Patescibacteria group bacterium]